MRPPPTPILHRSAESLRRKRGETRGLSRSSAVEVDRHVKFGDVEILEHERIFTQSPSDYAPKLAQGRLVNKLQVNMDTFERGKRAHGRTSPLLPLSDEERLSMAATGKNMLVSALGDDVQARRSAQSGSGGGGDFDDVDDADADGGDGGKLDDDAAPSEPEYHAELENWHLDTQGSVHHSGGITSKVGAVSGRIVTTSAYGSKYKLGTIKPSLRRALSLLGYRFNPDRPLDDPASLLHAWEYVCSGSTAMGSS